MSALDSPELAALAASRPPIASRTTAVVDACERQRLCERILSAPMQASSSAGQSHAHPKGLRVTAGVAAGVVGAGALAAGLVAVSGPGNTPPAGSRPTPPMMSAAYVVSQVVSAMNAPNDSVVETISQNTPTDPAIPALGGQDWRYPMSPKPGQQVQVASTTTSRSGRTLSAFFGTFVQPRKVQDHPAKGSCSGATGAGTDLNYTTRTFYRRSNFCTPPFDNGPSSPILLPSTDTQAFPTSITGELAQGFWSIVGHPKVDGQPTIELAPKHLTVLDAQSGLSLKVRLWVSPATYLPVKFVESVPADKAPVAPGWTETATYKYLAPTAANMAHLRLSIPAGFREVTQGAFHG